MALAVDTLWSKELEFYNQMKAAGGAHEAAKAAIDQSAQGLDDLENAVRELENARIQLGGAAFPNFEEVLGRARLGLAPA